MSGTVSGSDSVPGSDSVHGSDPGTESGSNSSTDSGSDPISLTGPYITSTEDIFISPFTPFLNHIIILERGGFDIPITRYCEQRRIYYALCTHVTNSIRCNNRLNYSYQSTLTCVYGCMKSDVEYVTYAEYLCPTCERLGRPEPAPTEADFFRCNTKWRTLWDLSRTRFLQLVSDAEQDGNLTLQDLEDPDELLRDPNILGQELLAENAAIELEDERQAAEEDDDDKDDDSESESESEPESEYEDFMEFDIPEPEPDESIGWVERLPPADSELTRRQWLGRTAWRRAVAHRMGNPPGHYYVPNSASDETDLMVRLQRLEADGESCGVCILEFNTEDGGDEDVRRLPCGHLFHFECILRWLYHRNCPVCRRVYMLRRMPRFEEGDGDSSSGSDPGQSSPPPQLPPAPGSLGRSSQGFDPQGVNPQGGDPQGGQHQGGASQAGAPQGNITQGSETQGNVPQGVGFQGTG
ncbi:hypothetical protein V496_02339 [Pseudogymnoascus sp. VKM F-4515 (FW-2607)]|nr:hypothetical protein V496_02339 [Pseudogymnoascus sp. VKM F-4515 (FW-2607)]KFY90516.1 hypothetical protein V498_05912 [Pseudogymnoascus sp. VKM F-4517 (FW-2822)]